MNVLKAHKNDILLISALLLLAGGLWLYTAFGRAPGAEISVTVDGTEVLRLPLDGDVRQTVGAGEHYNTFVIEKGEVYMAEAGCPDNICVQRGRVSLDGESIICLPNKTVITVVGGQDRGLDGVAG